LTVVLTETWILHSGVGVPLPGFKNHLSFLRKITAWTKRL
jgi:hypothetical protein